MGKVSIRRDGLWKIAWRVDQILEDSRVRFMEGASVECHVCRYCGIDFDDVRSTLYAVVPIAAAYFRSGGEHADAGLRLVRSAIDTAAQAADRIRDEKGIKPREIKLSDGDVYEIVKMMSPAFKAARVAETDDQMRRRIRARFAELKRKRNSARTRPTNRTK